MRAPQEYAASIISECDSLTTRNTAGLRLIRCEYSRLLKEMEGEVVIQIARLLRDSERYRWFGYELVRAHPEAFKRLDISLLEELGQGIDSWWTVDAFARTLSGPAWLAGLVPDDLIAKWAGSPDRWWRRAALVSTVALNVRSQGGKGDRPRTLHICRMLAADPDDMVVKALSWALRELVAHDPEAVRAYLDENEAILAGRVKR